MPRLSAQRITETTARAAKPGDTISDSSDRGFRLVVSPSGTKRFVAVYRVGSKGPSSKITLGHYSPQMTVSDARAKAQEVLALARAGKDPQRIATTLREAPTVADLARVYLDDYAPSQALRDGTVAHAKALLAVAITALGKRKVAEVAITDIRKLHGDTRAKGIEAGNKGVYQANRLLAVLSKSFALAIERGWRTDNPCKGVRKFPEDQRWRNLSDDEVGRLQSACDDYEAGKHLGGDKQSEAPTRELPESEEARRYREELAVNRKDAANAIRLLLFSGARLQEVLKAEWSQFDLERGLWEKPSSHTKTKRQHRLELEGPALELLLTMAEDARHPLYLFPGEARMRRKNAPVDIKTGEPEGCGPRRDLKRPWAKISERAGLDGVRLHDLRRTTASFMLTLGASLASVGKALGHTQASTTQRYAHLAPSVQRKGLGDAGRRMAALKGSALKGEVVALQRPPN